MTYVVTRVPQERLVIARFDLPIFRFLEDVRQFSALCAQVLAEEGAPLCRVIDLSDCEIEYSDLLLLLDEVRRERAGSLTDPRVHTAFVGTHPFIGLGIERIEAEFGVRLFQFATVRDALAFSRVCV